MHPLSFSSIRENAKWVCENATSVSIHSDHIARLVPVLADVSQEPWYESMPVKIIKDDFESALRFSMLFNATSFCYWQKPKWRLILGDKELGGAFSLATCYANAINQDDSLLSPENWLSIEHQRYLEMTKVSSGIVIPLSEQRVKAMHAMGELLAKDYHNSVQTFVEKHGKDAEKILQTLATKVYGYDDIHQFQGKSIPFLKRAQLTIADISSLYMKYEGLALENFRQVTACPDYKLPQIMRYYGLISYSDDLADAVDHEKELLSGSTPEVEVRAATVHVVELIKHQMVKEKNKDITSNQISDQIWLISQDQPADIQPHHHTITTYY